ncbi:serine/threonine protein kinase [Blastocystis sp. subtype 4]|uniref:serine/threonine protein kinase n=1 Tax=Blastocystis sp. subtype 4 TaxID=944170 RepID=UPI000711CE0F|nr:serine/threonine protein kinase [Blastocystis sp. subtype 4]KNB46336.1 serine/threonine protein kinase [Blastocystis sp. subtype 4]|eukprot:XP_014529777.1 serine/threonine protein kinase [Blastocystis sp. subtype 4]
MQNEVRFFYTPVGRSEYIVDEKVCRDSEARNHAAILYRKWIERLYQNADAQEYSKISDEIFQLFKRFSRSNDDYVHLGFLAVIDQLVDLGYQEEDRNVLSRDDDPRNSFNDASHSVVICNATMLTLGHLLRVGNSYLSEFIDSILSDAFRNLEFSRDDYKRLLSLLILQKVANNSPTHFYQHIQAFREKILAPLKDKQILIREAAADALSACLIIMQQRENQKKNDFYFEFLERIEELPKDGRNESIHGYLLSINSFLNNSLEFCDSRIEAIYTRIQTYFNTKEPYIKITIIRC